MAETMSIDTVDNIGHKVDTLILGKQQQWKVKIAETNEKETKVVNGISTSIIETIGIKFIVLFWKKERFQLQELQEQLKDVHNGEITPNSLGCRSYEEFCILLQNNNIPILVKDNVVSFDYDRYEKFLWHLLEAKQYEKVRLMYNFCEEIMLPGEEISRIEVQSIYVSKDGKTPRSTEVIIVSVKHAGFLCVQLKTERVSFMRMMDQLWYDMTKYGDKYRIPGEFVDVGLYCAVYDGRNGWWCRSQILKLYSDNTVKLCLIDYEEMIKVKEVDLRLLPKYCQPIKQQSLLVSLRGIEPINKETNRYKGTQKAITSKFMLAADYSLEAQFYLKSIPSEKMKYDVILLDTNLGKNSFVHEYLIEAKLAVKKIENAEDKSIKAKA